MSALSPSHVWGYRALFIAICIVLMTLKLLPLNLGGLAIPGPDLLVALAFAWIVRQPAVVSLGVLVGVFLMADFLFQRPPGLWTLLVILACESLRRRRLTMTEFPFLVEWGAASAAIIGMVLLNQIALRILLTDADPFGLSLAHGIVTIAVYPIVVGISKYVFRLRKLGPAELESY